MTNNGNNGNGRLKAVIEQIDKTLPEDYTNQILAWRERVIDGNGGNGHNLEQTVQREEREPALVTAARNGTLPAKDLTGYTGSGSRFYRN